MAALFRRRLAGDEPDREQWWDAASAARRVDQVLLGPGVADAAAELAGTYFAESLKDVVDFVDKSAFWPWVAERLLTHLREAPVPALT